MSKYDTVIIGNGPAGISCAIYLKRYNLNPLVIGYGYGALERATVDNYYGIKSIKGTDLINLGIEQAKELGIEVITDEVISIQYGDKFVVNSPNQKYECDSIFLAVGKTRNKVNVKNLQNYEGLGVSYCAICDGFFYKNKKIGIVGSGSYMLSELADLEKFTKDITIFTNGVEYSNDQYKVVIDKITELSGSDKLERVITENGSYDVDGLFIANGSASALSFSKHLGLETKDNNLVVNEHFMTNIPGIFAGGDVIGGLLQVSKAVSDGAQAAVEIKDFIKKIKL